MVWGDIKGQVGLQSVGGSLKEKEELSRRLFQEYTVEKWKKCCEHVYENEQKYRYHDHRIDSEVDRIIITWSPSDEDTSGYDDGSWYDGD